MVDATQTSHPPVAARDINVGDPERIISALAGGALVLRGLTRLNPLSLLLLLGGAALLRRGLTGHCALYQRLHTSGRAAVEGAAASPADFFRRGVHVVEAITIDRPPNLLFSFWRNLANLPRFMSHLNSVSPIDHLRSRWSARGPAGITIEWDAQIINEEPDRLIAWASLPGADVESRGSVHFDPLPNDRGVIVRVNLVYIPPAGRLGRAVARLLGEDPESTIRHDLRRLKQIIETGEVPTTAGQPSGPGQNR